MSEACGPSGYGIAWLQEMLKIPHSFMYCQKFPVKRTVCPLLGSRCWLKKAIGGTTPSISCCSTAPTASDEASVVSMVAAFGTGCASRAMSAKLVLMELNAATASYVHSNYFFDYFFIPFKRSLSGVRESAA